MGLSMSVGQLAWFLKEDDAEGAGDLRRAFRNVNRLLRSSKLPEHEEPESLPELTSRFTHLGQPYGWLHFLRRAVAHAVRGHKRLTPLSRSKDPSKDELYDNVLFSTDSHIVCHSDCGGFYVPIDFPDPLYDNLRDENPRCVEGGILGSSQAVMRELVQVAPLLGIRLRKGRLSDREAEAINGEDEKGVPFWVERQVWLEFYETARLSIEHGTAIVFG